MILASEWVEAWDTAKCSIMIGSVQLLSRVRLFATPWTTAHQASLSITNSQSLLKLISIESLMPSNHFILSCPLLLLPSIFPSIRVFSKEPALCIRWQKHWNFSFSISPSNEHQDWSPLGWTGWISFQSNDSQESSPTPQFKSINFLALSFLYSPTLIYPYMTTGKTIALTRWTFVGNVSAIFKKYAVKFGHNFSSREQVSFNFMAAVTICSDLGGPRK